MECILCNREIPSAAVCDECALAHLKDGWYVSGDISEGARRLMRMTDVVAVLDGNGYTVSLDGEDAGSRFAAMQPGVAGYTYACFLFNELMKELGQKMDDGDFIPPPYGFLGEAIKRIELFEADISYGGSVETYTRLALLYEAAARHFRLPYVSDYFTRTRKEELLDRARFWREKAGRASNGSRETAVEQPAVAAGNSSHDAEKADDDVTAGENTAPSSGSIVEEVSERQMVHENPFEPKVEMLKKRISEIEQGLKSAGTGSVSAIQRSEKEHVEQTPAARNRRKRAYLHYLAFSFDKAMSELNEIIDEGAGMEHDFALASLLALRTGKYQAIDELSEKAKLASVRLDNALLKAVVDWKVGMWGRALQLAQKEMKSGNYAAGFLLKRSICEQYNLREKYDELSEEGKKIHDLRAGTDLLSSIYLSIGTWGAALQVMGNLDRAEWSAETWTNMGMALEEKGDVNGANDAYEKALGMNGLLLPAIVRHALLQCKKGKHNSALEVLGRAGQLEPAVFRLQAAELVELGRKEEALELLRRLLEQDADDMEAASLGLRLSRELGDGDRERAFRIYVHRKEVHGGKE